MNSNFKFTVFDKQINNGNDNNPLLCFYYLLGSDLGVLNFAVFKADDLMVLL